jgi:hypothetical protein
MAEQEQANFKSPAHKQRFLHALRQISKVYEQGKLDPEYGAALYILTADGRTWQKAQAFVSRTGIDFPAMIEGQDWSGGYGVLIKWAGNLFNGETHIDPLELLRLDESNFELALDALKMRRYGLRVTVVEATPQLQDLLKRLPANYPPAKLTEVDGKFTLTIDSTAIFRDASSEDAIKHTTNYVEAREQNPNLPVGVIYGRYD